MSGSYFHVFCPGKLPDFEVFMNTPVITAAVNMDLYRYEIQALIREFFPGYEVKVLLSSPDSAETKDSFISVCYSEEGVTLTVRDIRGDAVPELPYFRNGGEKEKNADSSPIYIREAEAPAGGSFDVRSGDLRTALKHLLYDSLSEVMGKKLPWGELIGIRPTKLATREIEKGRGAEETIRYLGDNFRVSEEKARLSIEIAERERKILSRLTPEKGYSLYIGVPFCPTRCLYCSFPSFAIDAYRDRVGDYLAALEKEMKECSGMMKEQGAVLDTIYVGGGTPTALNAAELDRLLDSAENYFCPGDSLLEFTVEAGRPDSITKDKLEVLKSHHVSRISVNPQTMNDRTLSLIGRRHTVQQVIDAYYMARGAGMDNINMDIILGLPGETDEDVQRTIGEIGRLGPDDLTVHSLAVKRGSRMQEFIRENGYDTLHTNNTEKTMRIAAEGAAKMGLSPYYLYRQKNMSGNFENTGYARPGKYGIYNILIIEEVQSILALGPGSVSKRVVREENDNVTIRRCDDAKDIDSYIRGIDDMIGRKKRLFAADEREGE
jgi:coproporphyrinogen dehydrogenase HemZ